MSDAVDAILEHGLIAVIDSPIEDCLFEWAMAVSKGGMAVLGVPVTLPNVTEVVSDLADEAGLIVGVSDIRMPEQLSVALAAGAELVLSPVADWAIIEQAKMRGLSVIAGAFTPSEVHTAFMAGADLVSLHPVGVMPGGEAYFKKIKQSFGDKPILVSGGIGVENAPTFLELDACAAIVDTGLFPETNDPAAIEVITMRAAALTEVCADIRGTPKRLSITELRAASETPAATPASAVPKRAVPASAVPAPVVPARSVVPKPAAPAPAVPAMLDVPISVVPAPVPASVAPAVPAVATPSSTTSSPTPSAFPLEISDAISDALGADDFELHSAIEIDEPE